MDLDTRRAKLWDAMRLGPRWLTRPDEPAVQIEAAAATVAETAAGAATDGAVAGAARSNATPAGAAARAFVPRSAAMSADAQADATRVRPTTDTAARSSAIATMDWTQLRDAVGNCTACALCKSRTQTVFGVGNPRAHWMLIGEAPGAEEDARGEPFVGQAGRLLDNMLAAVGLARSGDEARSVFIANVLKCRPPGNRNPEPGEVALCEPFLLRQVALVDPKLIVVMGRFAAQSLLGSEATIASLRGRVHEIAVEGRRVPVVVTYHPAYLLRNLADKSKSWADLCLAQEVCARVTVTSPARDGH